ISARTARTTAWACEGWISIMTCTTGWGDIRTSRFRRVKRPNYAGGLVSRQSANLSSLANGWVSAEAGTTSTSGDATRSAHRQPGDLIMRSRVTCISLLLLSVAAALWPPSTAAEGPAQGLAKVAVLEDVVYGRVHGAGLLADIAYPASNERL